MRALTYLILLAVALLPLIATAQTSPTIDGRVALRGLYSVADGPVSKDVMFGFLDVDLWAKNVTGLGTGLVLDSTFLWDITKANERRFGETETIQQIRQLYVEQPKTLGSIKMSVGRRIITEAGNAWVDGVDARLSPTSDLTLGAYGGLRPDPADYSVTTTYQTAGLYGLLRRPGLSADFGYNAIFRKEFDRQYLYGRAHYRFTKSLYLSVYSIIDTLDEIEATTFLGTMDYSPAKGLNLTLNYSRYSVEAYRNQLIYRNITQLNQTLILGDEVIDLVYNRIRLSVSYRFWRRFYHYQSTEYKRRSQDRKESWSYTIGLRNNNLLGRGTHIDVRAIFRNNFQSDSWLLALDADQDLSAGISVNFHATLFDGRTIDRFTERGRTFDEAQRVYLAGGALFWRPGKAHHLSAAYDGVYETELQDQRNQDALFIHTMMLRYAYYY